MLILPDGSSAPVPTAIRLLYSGQSNGTSGTNWSSEGDRAYRSEHHTIQYAIAGSAAVQIDDVWYEFKAGEMILVPGYRWHRRRGDPGLILRWLGFNVQPLAVDLRIGACPKALVLKIKDHPILDAGVLASRSADKPLSAAKTITALHLAITMLLEEAVGQPVPDLEPAVIRARDFIERNYLRSPSLNEIAAAAKRSPHHLHQRFSATVGCTPAVYSQRLRLRDAQALLSGGSLSVQEVAQRSGYPDPFHFARVFRREFGISPSEMRRKHVSS